MKSHETQRARTMIQRARAQTLRPQTQTLRGYAPRAQKQAVRPQQPTAHRRNLAARARRMKGQPVCIVLKDGTCWFGKLQDIGDRELTLAGAAVKKRAQPRRHGGRPSASERAFKTLPQDSALLSGFLSYPFNDLLKTLNPGKPAAKAAPEITSAPATAPEQGGSPGGLGGLEDMFGTMQRIWPMVRMGMDMVKTIMPLFK